MYTHIGNNIHSLDEKNSESLQSTQQSPCFYWELGRENNARKYFHLTTIYQHFKENVTAL